MRPVFVLALGCLIPACGTRVATESPPTTTDSQPSAAPTGTTTDSRPTTVTRQLRGVLTFFFEHSDFTACDSTKTYWFSSRARVPGWEKAEAIFNARDTSHTGGSMVRLYVEMRGQIIGPGRYGHLGAYDYQLYPLEIIDARAGVPPDCRVPSGADAGQRRPTKR